MKLDSKCLVRNRMHMHVLVSKHVKHTVTLGCGRAESLFHDEEREDTYVKLQNIRFI